MANEIKIDAADIGANMVKNDAFRIVLSIRKGNYSLCAVLSEKLFK